MFNYLYQLLIWNKGVQSFGVVFVYLLLKKPAIHVTTVMSLEGMKI